MSPPDIHDIKGLFALYGWYRPLLWLLIAGVVALLVFGLYGLYRWWRSRPRGKPAPAPRPPYELAIERLERLRESAGDAVPKPLYFELSQTLREYLEWRFAVPATDRTTEELRELVGRVPELAGSEKESLLFVLGQADVVKFTDLHPAIESRRALLGRAIEFVTRTKPPEPPPEAEP